MMVNLFKLPADTTKNGLLNLAAGVGSTIKLNLSASTDPGVSDDSSASYSLGSIWINSGKRVFIATDVSVGAAVWRFFGDNNYIVATGTDTYAAVFNPAWASYKTGAEVLITFTNANTGAATLNVNALGAKAIKKNGVAVVSGDIPASSSISLVYNGTDFLMIGSASSGGGSSSGGGVAGIFKFMGA